MTEREQSHEKIAHTIIEKNGERSKRKFFKNWKTLKNENVALTSQLLAKQIVEKTTARLAFCETQTHEGRKDKNNIKLRPYCVF